MPAPYPTEHIYPKRRDSDCDSCHGTGWMVLGREPDGEYDTEPCDYCQPDEYPPTPLTNREDDI